MLDDTGPLPTTVTFPAADSTSGETGLTTMLELGTLPDLTEGGMITVTIGDPDNPASPTYVPGSMGEDVYGDGGGDRWPRPWTITGVPETSIAPFTATITFDEAVTGFTQLTTSRRGNADSLRLCTGTPRLAPEWTVLVTPTTDGEVTLDIAANMATAADAGSTGAGNTAAVQATSTYDGTDPTVVSN